MACDTRGPRRAAAAPPPRRGRTRPSRRRVHAVVVARARVVGVACTSCRRNTSRVASASASALPRAFLSVRGNTVDVAKHRQNDGLQPQDDFNILYGIMFRALVASASS